jgi:hypothetical protein
MRRLHHDPTALDACRLQRTSLVSTHPLPPAVPAPLRPPTPRALGFDSHLLGCFPLFSEKTASTNSQSIPAPASCTSWNREMHTLGLAAVGATPRWRCAPHGHPSLSGRQRPWLPWPGWRPWLPLHWALATRAAPCRAPGQDASRPSVTRTGQVKPPRKTAGPDVQNPRDQGGQHLHGRQRLVSRWYSYLVLLAARGITTCGGAEW